MEARLEAEAFSARADITHRRLRAFLHPLGKKARHDESPFAGDDARFAFKNGAACEVDAKTVREPDLIATDDLILGITRRPKLRLDVFGAYMDRLGKRLTGALSGQDDLLGEFSANRADLALKVPNARLTRIALNDVPDGRVVNAHVDAGETRRFRLARNEVSLCNGELFKLRISGKLNDLHAITEGVGDRAERVRGRDEHHIAQIVVEIEVV